MTERTKIERVGRHLLIGDAAIPIAPMRAFSCTEADVQCSVWSDNDAMDVAPIVAHGWTAREVLEVAYGGGEWLYHPKPTDETRALVDEINALVETGSEEIERLRARVAELEEENEQLRWARRASCVRTPTPGCDCPGCETARERAAQVDLVESYEAELEEDRQAERDRILGARVREIARQYDGECRLCGLQVMEEGQLYDDGSLLACGDGHLSIVWCDEDSCIAFISNSLDMAEALDLFGERVSDSPMDRFDRADLKEMIKAAQALTRHAEFGLRVRNAYARLDKHGDPNGFAREVAKAIDDALREEEAGND